jgi:hypothetical protein
MPLAYLIAPHVGPGTVEVGEVEEVLTDNAPLALQGALWELDQDIGALATDETRWWRWSAFAEALMKKVQIRAENGGGCRSFTGSVGRSRRIGLTLRGSSRPRRRRVARSPWPSRSRRRWWATTSPSTNPAAVEDADGL